MTNSVDAKTLKAWLSDGKELALFDVREVGPYSEGHPFFAVPLHYSRLELDVERLAPAKSVRMVVFDGGRDGLAATAARRLEALGYTSSSAGHRPGKPLASPCLKASTCLRKPSAR
jgi:rhodanese-related sulfurtransferase